MRSWGVLAMLVWSLWLASCESTTKPGTASSSGAEAPQGATISRDLESRVRRGDTYYRSTCARCDRTLGTVGVAVDANLGERSLRFCTPACEGAFRADADAGIRHIDEVIRRDQLPHYPISTSIVSGKPLGERPVDYVWCNRLVRFAHIEEQAVFLGDPERYVSALDEQVLTAQAPTYGMPTRCPVQGDILDSDTPMDFVIANRMIRVCCARCVRSVRARPYQYLAMIDFANREARERAAASE